MSFARAFLAAGVRRAIVSLWPVWDRTAGQLMQSFYAELALGVEPAAALRRAQLTVRADHPHPYYWAPFTLVGI